MALKAFATYGQHRVSACRIPKRCHKCGRKHHTTIHQANSQPSCSESGSTKSIESTATAPKTTDTHVLHSISSQKISSCVFLATAQVTVVAQNGEISRVRALIDQGSEISLISERLVQRLKLPRRKSSLPLVGIGAQKSSQTRGITSFKLRPYDGDLEHCISAHILPKFTSSIPSIIEEGIIKGNGNSPIAQSTKFGWIISGPSGANESSAIKHSYHVSMDRELHDLLYRFWELEEIPSRKNSSISNEEQECEQHFKSTHARDAHGRYIVKLPFKDDVNKLGDSRIKAVRMIKGLTKKFASDQQYAQSYAQFMKEYEELHHMKLLPEGLTKSELPHVYYLPHHGVVRQQSLTTKLRVVFNGSSRTTTGISLNDILHTGAKL
ncbi:uncharacterized protein LOC115240470 [Formica exsecta]|uniref:uncharacterized protein LOC115240470 n=1 Tax=Formica exsecta TaxID=72781 RepID=UPI0011445DD7|nr:uncharacterized protein LOC115240470 [Formica exsecta]